MNQDPTSLARLHDIIVPPPAPFWPPAPGWLWVLGVLLVASVVLGLRAWARRQANRYRREALSELARLERAEPVVALTGISELLKRTALTAYPREEVAGLSGDEWFAFLDRTGGTHFTEGPGSFMEHAVYINGAGGTDSAALFDEARTWIRRHTPC